MNRVEEYCFPIIGNEAKLPIFLVGVGANEYQYHLNRTEGYPYHQFIYCTKGEGLLRVNGKEYRISQGKGFYLPPKLAHEYFRTQDKWETHWVTFDGEGAQELLDSLDFKDAKVFTLFDISIAESVFKKLLLTAKTGGFYGGYQSSGILYQLILEIYRLSIQSPVFADQTKLSTIKPVIDYIENNSDKDITLEELSELVHLSPQYLCRLFKECLSLRPFEFLARQRIQNAKALLLEGSLSINEIAEHVGYNDSSYFCAVFKRHEMMSPAEFRSLHKR